MTTELTILALAAILQAGQIFLAAIVMNADVGADWNVGPRDSHPEFSAMTGRLRRAVNNHFEALVFFTIAVVVISMSGKGNGLTAVAAWVYLAARILYIPAYAFGWSPWRTVIWGTGFAATMLMIVVALL